jgi:hypothetical protein
VNDVPTQTVRSQAPVEINGRPVQMIVIDADELVNQTVQIADNDNMILKATW